MFIKNILFLSIMILIFFNHYKAMSNNVKVENLRLTGQDVVADTKLVEFDLSWDNSWRTSASPGNRDAVWLFAKYRLTSGSLWNHATLSSTSGDHTSPTGSTIDAVPDSRGVFIYRDADGAGNNDFDDVQLLWDYGTDGLADVDSVEICVLAIEMVYVPEGGFAIGDGNGTIDGNGSFELTSNLNNFVTISTALTSSLVSGLLADDIQLRTTGLRLDGDGGIDEDNNGFVDHPNFPVGYNAFYCMKYEITQGQFVEFANRINNGQNNIISAATTNRRNILGSGSSWSSSTPNRAHGMGWPSLVAYADWAGLRPITETEFEKACRGSNSPIYREFAWGSGNIHNATYALVFDGTESESISNPGNGTGNAIFNTTFGLGPARTGIFAASSSAHTREETGGSFYGIMELSGNMDEAVVILGDADGRDFDGSHGNGEVNVNGYADNAGWPGYDGSQIDGTPASGWGYRGGGNTSNSLQITVSDRTNVGSHTATTTSGTRGGRCVRTAP